MRMARWAPENKLLRRTFSSGRKLNAQQVVLLLDFNDFNFLTPTGKEITSVTLCNFCDCNNKDFMYNLIIQGEGY